MSAVSKAVNKPQLRGLLNKQIKLNIIMAFVVAGVAATAQKIFINDERKKIYAAFYKNYDADKAFNQMRSKGLFDSC